MSNVFDKIKHSHLHFKTNSLGNLSYVGDIHTKLFITGNNSHVHWEYEQAVLGKLQNKANSIVKKLT